MGCWSQETVFSSKLHSCGFNCKLEQTEYILLNGLGISFLNFLDKICDAMVSPLEKECYINVVTSFPDRVNLVGRELKYAIFYNH